VAGAPASSGKAGGRPNSPIGIANPFSILRRSSMSATLSCVNPHYGTHMDFLGFSGLFAVKRNFSQSEVGV
jgi:hypothetical protein